ncbi:MAG TPA: glycosyltransferase family 4 protein [Solirubrobacteraceae bacterium]|jgi:glycosyltransferase involved in cell wall biosynthesis|nr:glycosyltransferase family 4 protein [Solirubrobacteraceae bacterium]
MALRVVSAVLFSPRGGSAHAARALARGLRTQGCSVTLVAGSRRDLGVHGDARAFYRDVHAVEFDAALASGDPLRFDGPTGSAPMHPSFEDRAGAPDRVFATLDDLDYERQVRAWCRELRHAGAAGADVLHLHHLTPLNEAAARIAPHVPVVGQLHGTELLMLERIAAGAPSEWRHAERWAERMRGWAQRCARLIVAPAGVERALTLLGVPRERVVALANGVDVELFRPRALDRDAFWRHALVEQPQGWVPDQPPGSARYDDAAVAALAAGTVLLHVGRFTAVKRLDRLIGAFGRAQEHLTTPAGLVLVGGHPGEWENEHPTQIAARLGIPNVFLAGWHTQDELPAFFRAADAVVLASEREQFGQALIEGMACALPAIATRSLGPAAIIEHGRTGWLTPPDDETALAVALTEAVNDPHERQQRGRQARRTVCEHFSWSKIATQLATTLEDVTASGRRAPAIEA